MKCSNLHALRLNLKLYVAILHPSTCVSEFNIFPLSNWMYMPFCNYSETNIHPETNMHADRSTFEVKLLVELVC